MAAANAGTAVPEESGWGYDIVFFYDGIIDRPAPKPNPRDLEIAVTKRDGTETAG